MIKTIYIARSLYPEIRPDTGFAVGPIGTPIPKEFEYVPEAYYDEWDPFHQGYKDDKYVWQKWEPSDFEQVVVDDFSGLVAEATREDQKAGKPLYARKGEDNKVVIEAGEVQE